MYSYLTLSVAYISSVFIFSLLICTKAIDACILTHTSQWKCDKSLPEKVFKVEPLWQNIQHFISLFRIARGVGIGPLLCSPEFPCNGQIVESGAFISMNRAESQWRCTKRISVPNSPNQGKPGIESNLRLSLSAFHSFVLHTCSLPFMFLQRGKPLLTDSNMFLTAYL